jgi:hypothetical protein
VVMCGKFQEELKHEIVKIVKTTMECRPRLSLTFRQFVSME